MTFFHFVFSMRILLCKQSSSLICTRWASSLCLFYCISNYRLTHELVTRLKSWSSRRRIHFWYLPAPSYAYSAPQSHRQIIAVNFKYYCINTQQTNTTVYRESVAQTPADHLWLSKLFYTPHGPDNMFLKRLDLMSLRRSDRMARIAETSCLSIASFVSSMLSYWTF